MTQGQDNFLNQAIFNKLGRGILGILGDNTAIYKISILFACIGSDKYQCRIITPWGSSLFRSRAIISINLVGIHWQMLFTK